tara:strand:- start:3246 stop:4196 length:951 start_codon:yes stop_codon:yes gene_type:complete
MRYIKILIFFLFISFASIAPYSAYLNDIPNYQVKTIDIYQGESINKVISKFSSHNFINKIFLKIFLKLEGISDFKTGEYNIDNMTMKEIIYSINRGDTITHKLIIREGTNIHEIQDMIDDSFLINDCEYLNCLDGYFPFSEGVLYPDTYFYKKGMNASTLLRMSNKRLNNFLNETLKDNPINPLLDRNKILILASIIEKEAGNNLEKPLIAGVFIKRLSINMKLQADPTIIYGLLPNFDGDIKKSDILDSNNKYNTYMIYGLPPTPIAVSSESSILAAVNAEPGDYLFFVADTPNSHYFSKDYDEHLRMIKDLGLN